ncbi:hypothetical protein T484DRAFT_1776031 [Baffinella frigidus]|nr:hypothetical protein T484DRAFT_1776031 [Cryptophyta sp. CCMP2293]
MFPDEDLVRARASEQFDADGNFYPNKDMGEERFFERLDQEMEQDRLECEQIDREDDEELNRTGKLERHEWREEFLDEDGYINDISLLPNSTFLQARALLLLLRLPPRTPAGSIYTGNTHGRNAGA